MTTTVSREPSGAMIIPMTAVTVTRIVTVRVVGVRTMRRVRAHSTRATATRAHDSERCRDRVDVRFARLCHASRLHAT